MLGYTVQLLLLVNQLPHVLADHRLVHREIAEANSTRELKHTNQTIRFAWLNIENKTEPEWSFFLNGIDMELLLPHSWNLTRTDNSIELEYTHEVNFEVLARGGTYLSVEAEIRNEKSGYSRLVFQRKLLWNVGTDYICDKISQGTYCELCTREAKPDELRADACVALTVYASSNYFMSTLLTPTIIGCILFLGQVLAWTLFCLKVWREQKATQHRPSQKKATKKSSNIELIISDPRLAEDDDVGAANASTSNSKLAKREWEPKEEINANASKLQVEKLPSTNSKTKPAELQASVSAPKRLATPEKKKTLLKVKDKPVLERIIAQNRTKEISKRLLAIEPSKKAAVEVNVTESVQKKSSEKIAVKRWPTSAQVAELKSEED